MAVWLAQQEHEGSGEAFDLGRIVLHAGLKHEPADQGERYAPREIPDAAEPEHEILLGFGHLFTLQVLLEPGREGFEELTEAGCDRNQPYRQDGPLTCRVREDLGDRRLCAVLRRRSSRSHEQLEGEKGETGVGDPAPGKTESLRDSRCISTTMQGVEDRPDKSPQRVRGQADDKDDQHDLAKSTAGQRREAARLVGGLASEAECEAEGKRAHDDVEDPAGDVSDPLEELYPLVRRRAFDGCAGMRNWAGGKCHIAG